MLFEMVAGTRPFKGCEHEECELEHQTSIPPNPATLNPKVPQSLATLILKCLEKTPDDRPADFNILETELSRILWDMYRERLPYVIAEELTLEEICDRSAALAVLGYGDEALACFDQVLSVRPRLANAWQGKASTLAGLGRYADALVCYERTLELTPSLDHPSPGVERERC